MRKYLFAFVLLGFFIVFLSAGAFAQNKTVAKYAIELAQFSDTLRITLDALVGENDSIIILGAGNFPCICNQFPGESLNYCSVIKDVRGFVLRAQYDY